MFVNSSALNEKIPNQCFKTQFLSLNLLADICSLVKAGRRLVQFSDRTHGFCLQSIRVNFYTSFVVNLRDNSRRIYATEDMVKDALVSNLMIMYLSSKEGNGENAQNFIQYLIEAEIKQTQELWFLT